jgi:hypothetical protein
MVTAFRDLDRVWLPEAEGIDGTADHERQDPQ